MQNIEKMRDNDERDLLPTKRDFISISQYHTTLEEQTDISTLLYFLPCYYGPISIKYLLS